MARGRRGRPRPCRSNVTRLQIEDYVLPHSPHTCNSTELECGRNFPCRRLQRLRLRPQPHRFDHIPSDAGGKPAGNGLNLRKFRHDLVVYRGRLWARTFIGGCVLQLLILPPPGYHCKYTSAPLLSLSFSLLSHFFWGNECVRPCNPAGWPYHSASAEFPSGVS
jgi:hypothetical protein